MNSNYEPGRGSPQEIMVKALRARGPMRAAELAKLTNGITHQINGQLRQPISVGLVRFNHFTRCYEPVGDEHAHAERPAEEADEATYRPPKAFVAASIWDYAREIHSENP